MRRYENEKMIYRPHLCSDALGKKGAESSRCNPFTSWFIHPGDLGRVMTFHSPVWLLEGRKSPLAREVSFRATSQSTVEHKNKHHRMIIPRISTIGILRIIADNHSQGSSCTNYGIFLARSPMWDPELTTLLAARRGEANGLTHRWSTSNGMNDYSDCSIFTTAVEMVNVEFFGCKTCKWGAYVRFDGVFFSQSLMSCIQFWVWKVCLFLIIVPW